MEPYEYFIQGCLASRYGQLSQQSTVKSMEEAHRQLTDNGIDHGLPISGDKMKVS